VSERRAAPLAPEFSETPLWHADVGRPAGIEDPDPVPPEADVVVVGGGYCGITAAAELAARGQHAVVIEADAIGTGASTRNGGMVIPELKHGPSGLEKKLGPLGRRLYAEVNEAFEREIVPSVNAFQPELILLSAGFDAHRDDPIAELWFTENSFTYMTRQILELADRHCGGRVVSVLEGGYQIESLVPSVIAHIRALQGR